MRHGAVSSIALLVVASLVPAVATASPPLAARWLHEGDVPLAKGGDLETRARAGLAALAPEASGASLLRTDVQTFGDGDTIVRFGQSWRGLPVVGRGASVRIDGRGHARLAATNVETVMPASDVPALSSAAAAAIAQRYTPLPTRPSDAHLVVYPTRGTGGRLAWAVVPQMIAGLPTSPRVLVDAETAEVLEARDTVVFANVANVYPTNPVASPTLAPLDLPIPPDGSGFLTNPFLLTYNCIDKKTVSTVSFGGFSLPVHVCDLLQTATPNGNGDWMYDPKDVPGDPESRSDAFSEVSMYYHATRAYEMFRTLQGNPTAQVVSDKPLRTISNLQLPPGASKGDFQSAGDPNKPLDPFSNAFFAPAGGGLGQLFQSLYGFNAGAMWFGQGPKRDFSYDGDVVYHEFGHAVVDATLQLGGWTLDAWGAIDAPGGMNEGLADYFSAALSGDGKVGEYASQDFDATRSAIRDLANQNTCTGTMVSEVHQDSTFFSGGLWAVRQGLAAGDRTKFDAAIYKAMRSNPGKPELNYSEAVLLFLATLKTDLPAAAKALEDEMTKGRGILPDCTRVHEWAGKPIEPGNGWPGGFVAPGKATLGIQKAQGDLAPGILQVHAALDKVVQVVVTFTSTQQPQAGGGLFGPQGTPFAPVVLARFGGPLQWTTSGKIQPNADVRVEATGDKAKPTQKFAATIDVPEGVTELSIQIANSGDQDGSYQGLSLQLVQAEIPLPTTPPTTPTASSGCSCSTPPSTGPGPWAAALGGLALAGLGMRRRRR